MAKIVLKVKPIFMKIILVTPEGLTYTIGPFIYNPHIRFNYTLNNFINWITNINIFKLKYDIAVSCRISFIMVYQIEDIEKVKSYEVVYPILEDFQISTLLEDIEHKLKYKEELESKLNKLIEEIKTSKREAGKLMDKRKIKGKTPAT